MDIKVEGHSHPDGWYALYINGKCVRQTHGCDLLEEWLAGHFRDENPEPVNILSLSFHDHDEGDDEVYQYVERTGRFPETLKEIHELLSPFTD